MNSPTALSVLFLPPFSTVGSRVCALWPRSAPACLLILLSSLAVKVLWDGGMHPKALWQRAIGGSKSHRDDCCVMQRQIVGLCGGRIGDSLTSGSQKDPCIKVRLLQSRIVHSRNVHMEPCIPPLLAAWITQPLLLCSPYFLLLCILKSGTVTCLIRYIVPTKWR